MMGLVQLENITRLQDVYAKNIIIRGKEILLLFEETNLCMQILILIILQICIYFFVATGTRFCFRFPKFPEIFKNILLK